ncbi:MAG: hypothetical protein ACQJCO_04630 [cyanobacterium endosymbiont of Rhopalodia sterrenbergii]
MLLLPKWMSFYGQGDQLIPFLEALLVQQLRQQVTFLEGWVDAYPL